MTGSRDAVGTAAAVRSGEVDARAVVEDAIACIERLNPEYNAVIHTRFDRALEEVDAGLPDGPLRGVPVLIKDLGTDVAGLPSTGGSRLFAEGLAARDSELVTRYRRAGMVVLGSTNTPNWGSTPVPSPRCSARPAIRGAPPTRRAAPAAGRPSRWPRGWSRSRTPATAEGPSASRRRPAVCSVSSPAAAGCPRAAAHHAVGAGLRAPCRHHHGAGQRPAPRHRRGTAPGDAYAAPTPADSFAALARREPGRLRIGLITALPDGPEVHPEPAAAAIAAARLCESLGHEVEEATAAYRPADVAGASAVLMGSGLVAQIDARLEQLGRPLADDDLEPFTRVLYDSYRALTAADVSRALGRMQEIGWAVGAAFSTYDVLLSPTLARPTPRLGTLDTNRPESIYEHASVYSAFTSVHNVTGMPAMSVPLGRDGDGLPLGVQFAADLGGEGLLLSLAAQLEQAAPWSAARVQEGPVT